MKALLMGALLFAARGATGALGQGAAAPANPEVAATAFYKWYLHELSVNHDPVSDNPGGLATYVSRPLLREIKRRMSSADGLDADYFLQAQDYLNDWLKNVTASETKVLASSASTVVTLGERPDSRYRLAVGLVKDDGTWKIRRVARLRASGTR